MDHRPPLPDEIRTTLPRIVQDYIDALESALSAASGEATALRTRLSALEAGQRASVTHPNWPAAFFDRTAGAWQGEPPVRPGQGDYEEREPIE